MREWGVLELAFYGVGLFMVVLFVVGVPLLIAKEKVLAWWRKRH